MKIIVTFYKEKTGKYVQKEFPSITAGATYIGRAPRLLSQKLKHGGKDITTKYGTIISVEAYDGKTDNPSSAVREYTDQSEENQSLGIVEVHGGGGWFQQALGKATVAVQWCLSKFN